MTIKELQRRRKSGASLEILADLAGCTIAEIKEALGYSGGDHVIEPSEVAGKANYTFDTEKAILLYEQGLSDSKIAERMGLVTNTIWRWRKIEGLPTKHAKHAKRVDAGKIVELHAEGLLPAEICRKLDISGSTYYRWKRKIGLPSLPKWDREATMRLYEQGYNDTEIGEQVGVSRQTIGDWRRDKGLPANGRRRALR